EIEPLPPPRNEPPKPLPAPEPQQEAKPLNPLPVPPLLAPPPALPFAAESGSVRKYKGPSEFDLLNQLTLADEFGLSQSARQSMAAAYQTDYQASSRMAMRPGAEPSTLLQFFPSAGQLPIRPAP